LVGLKNALEFSKLAANRIYCNPTCNPSMPLKRNAGKAFRHTRRYCAQYTIRQPFNVCTMHLQLIGTLLISLTRHA